jgi:hypothetical protein
VLTPALVEVQAISARRSASCEGHGPVESRLIVIMVVEVSTPSPGYASWRLPVSPLAEMGVSGASDGLTGVAWPSGRAAFSVVYISPRGSAPAGRPAGGCCDGCGERSGYCWAGKPGPPSTPTICRVVSERLTVAAPT